MQAGTFILSCIFILNSSSQHPLDVPQEIVVDEITGTWLMTTETDEGKKLLDQRTTISDWPSRKGVYVCANPNWKKQKSFFYFTNIDGELYVNSGNIPLDSDKLDDCKRWTIMKFVKESDDLVYLKEWNVDLVKAQIKNGNLRGMPGNSSAITELSETLRTFVSKNAKEAFSGGRTFTLVRAK